MPTAILNPACSLNGKETAGGGDRSGAGSFGQRDGRRTLRGTRVHLPTPPDRREVIGKARFQTDSHRVLSGYISQCWRRGSRPRLAAEGGSMFISAVVAVWYRFDQSTEMPACFPSVSREFLVAPWQCIQKCGPESC